MKDYKYRKLAIGTLFCCISFGFSRLPAPGKYTAANAHSHNDYKQAHPFFEAYQAGFGSMEADIYIRDGVLLVAHEEKEIKRDNTLEQLYLLPLSAKIKACEGTPYKDRQRQLQLLIELKASPEAALDTLASLLRKYPEIAKNKNIQIVFTGITPSESVILHTPDYMYFDFAPGTAFDKKILGKIAMFSDDFRRYSNWNGTGDINPKELLALKAVVKKYHDLHKKVRFWDTPDNDRTWRLMETLGVDYINTDRIEQLAQFLKEEK